MSYGRFNPNDPFLIGLEWPATLSRADPIDPSRELAQAVHMTANATAAHLNFYSPGPEACSPECLFTNWIMASIYEAGQEMNYGSVRDAQSVVSGGSTTGTLQGGAVSVADALLSPADGKYITLNPGETIDIEFATPFFLVGQPRILDVSFTAAVIGDIAGTLTQSRIGHAFQLGASIVPLGVSLPPAVGGYSTHVLSTGEVFLGGYDYIATPTETRRRGWRYGDFTNLTSGTVRYRVSNASVLADALVHYVRMTVTYCQENRIGTGGIIRSGLNVNNRWVPGWQSGMDITNPTTGALGVSLLAGRDYVVSLAQASNSELTSALPVTGAPAPVWVESGASRDLGALAPTAGSPIDCLVYPRLDDGRIGGPGVAADRGFTMVLMDAASVSIADLSQPYAEVVTAAPPVSAQEVLSTTGGLYASVRVTVRKVGNPSDLVFTVGASSGTLTVAAFDALEHDAEGFATTTVPVSPPVTLAAGAEVVIAAFTLATPDHWEIPILSTIDNSFIYTSVTYGGEFQAAVFPGLDTPVLLQMAVPTVTGATLTRGTMTLAPAVTGCPRPQGMFTSLEYTTLCWGEIPLVSGAPPMASGAPIVSGFCAWDVERRDANDLDWRQIAHITDRDVRCVSDFEGRFGESTDYRVRLCRLDGACGDWAAVTGFVRASPTPGSASCDGLVFTSNEDPGSTLAYSSVFEGAPAEDFEFVEAETLVLQRLHMRDYQVAFRPLERGGVRFSRTMLVNAISVPASRLDEGFRDLRDLAWASLSYVAVLDTRGNRWFASVNVPSGSVRASKNIYLASVDVVETTNRPSVIDVAVV